MKTKEATEASWIELESDPGLFTLLLEDFGVTDVDVEEIYDLANLEAPIAKDVYGFVFLCKWVESTSNRLAGRRGRKAEVPTTGVLLTDEDKIQEMFFAHQIAPNSCATHALLSVLLNCEGLHLGERLGELLRLTKGLNPEVKGVSISSMPELARAHNSHATPAAVREAETFSDESGRGLRGVGFAGAAEQFHFVSYVPIKGHLYELDGLKSAPIDHGEIQSGVNWIDMFRTIITARISANVAECIPEEIRYNLMAVVQCERSRLNEKLAELVKTEQEMLERLEKVGMRYPNCMKVSSSIGQLSESLTKMNSENVNLKPSASSTPNENDCGQSASQFYLSKCPSLCSRPSPNSSPVKLLHDIKQLEAQIRLVRSAIDQELQKHQQYRIDAGRRTHDYAEFITTFLQLTAKKRRKS